MSYLIFTKPVYKDYIWGGNRLKEYFGKDVDLPKVAESWEISTNKDGVNGIENTNITLQELFERKEREEVFGTKTKDLERFPLLIKFIDAESNLSVQVHPNDEYAKRVENNTGKNEMWYIVECAENSQIICGMKEHVKQEEIEDIIKNGKIKDNVNYINIKKGDSIYIPSGTVHSILGDTLICEVQQNSNLTYRVYDWDRLGKDGKPRELHLDKAIDVIDVNSKPIIKHKENNKLVTRLIQTEYFCTDLLQISECYKDESNIETFYAMNVINGEGQIVVNNRISNIKKGDSFIVPANLGKYEIRGKMEILKSYI